jgi:hypothetical protein
MIELPSAVVTALTGYMFLPDTELHADCTIVLGMTLFHRPVSRVVELHDRGMTGVIVFSGGYNHRLQSLEADQMLALWRRLGRPDAAVEIEAESTNTRENMVGVKNLLEQRGLLPEIRSINIVTISYHMRRALETFRDIFGEALAVGTASYPSQYCPPQGWADDIRGRDLVLAEYGKIHRYLPHRLGVAAQIW